jgi:hypothetical protein
MLPPESIGSRLHEAELLIWAPLVTWARIFTIDWTIFVTLDWTRLATINWAVFGTIALWRGRFGTIL